MTRNPLLRTWKGSLACRADKFPTREEENLSFAATRRGFPAGLRRRCLDGRAPCPANRRNEVKGPYEGVEFGSLGRDALAGLREMRNSSSRDGGATKANGKRAVPHFFSRHFLPPFLSPFPSSSPVSSAVSSFFPLGPSSRRLRSFLSLSLSLFLFLFRRSILIRARTSAQVNLRERMQNAMQTLIERNTREGGRKPIQHKLHARVRTTGAALAKFPSFFGNARSFAKHLAQQLRNGKRPRVIGIERLLKRDRKQSRARSSLIERRRRDTRETILKTWNLQEKH